jgi:hypothetical protein
MNATYDRLLKAGGKFENGVYKGFKPDGSPKNRDSYEAIWEEHEGRELVFPPPRYREPVMMLSKNSRFWPDRKRPGLEIKHLGTFSEARTGIGFLRIVAGAARPRGEQDDAELLYCFDGSFTCDGKTYGKGTYLFLPNGAEVKALGSTTGAEFFVITLPMLADLVATQKTASSHPAIRAKERVG